MPRRLQEKIGRSEGGQPLGLISGKVLPPRSLCDCGARLLILDADPLFQDKIARDFRTDRRRRNAHYADAFPKRNRFSWVRIFDAFVVEGQSMLAVCVNCRTMGKRRLLII
jgi:hypothetical protein